ncbi:MAG TPA: DUF1499 domain-containing protein [Desulfuromonadaceae bacterium]
MDNERQAIPEKSPRLTYYKAVLAAAIISLAMLVMAGWGSRIGLWHFRTGFDILRYGGYFGLIAAVGALTGIVTASRQKRPLGAIISIAALVIGLTAFAVPYSWKRAAARLPRIHDISTDINNPLRFVAAIPLRKDAANPVEYGGAEIAAKQLQAYPDLKTVILELPLDQAYALALDTARKMGWQITASVPGEGRIEATDTTRWFGFKDDIVIRLASAGTRSLVDVRSLSRVGISDAGTNAARIRGYILKLQGKK